MCLEIPEYVHFLIFLFALLAIMFICAVLVQKMMPPPDKSYYK